MVEEAVEAPSGKSGQITVFHILVVALSLMLTLGAWQFATRQVETRTQLRFEAARDRALGLITDRMIKYEDALWAGVAAVESHGGAIPYQSWKTFAQTLRIEERYPGINGIGVIYHHTPATLAPFLASQREERPDFRVFPDHDQPFYMPITYIEPQAANAAAVGLDVAHERNRRTAALASRDTATAQITGPIVLVQDAGRTPGFLFYAPFYEGGPPASADDRAGRFLGAVYAPFVVHKLMEGLLAKELREVRFSIRDGDETLYDEHTQEDPLRDPSPLFSQDVVLDVYGRTWVLDMRTDLTFRQENTHAKPQIILLAGLIIELLIISLLLMMSRANKHAIAYANRLTAALRAETEKLGEANAQLSAKNEELQRFAYVVSHDLKTPIRGISGLTEMVQEDLEQYLETDAANPDVEMNLRRIQERVKRMEELTNGIMDLSRIDAQPLSGAAVPVAAVVEEIAQDLDLAPDQVHLTGGPLSVATDPINFRSVVENLIGNAIKYHDGVRELHIGIEVSEHADRLLVSVQDNGPGIDARFHDRIFDVFQTLRTEGYAESTGIGLSIVKKAVERHGGSVHLTSQPGAGAKFSFDWPAGNSQSGADGLDHAA